MKVRKATLKDAEAILYLQIETIRSSNSVDYTCQEIDAWIASRCLEHMKWLVDHEHVWVAADSSNKIFGFGTLKGNSVLQLFVAPQYQRRGIGSAIFTALEETGINNGFSEIVTESTITAVQFYKRKGFQEVTRKKWGDAQMEVVLMRKLLKTLGHDLDTKAKNGID